MKRDKCQVTSDPRTVAAYTSYAGHASRITHRAPAFSLIELLVVISILGLLAGIAVPALKDLGKSNIQISAARQMLDDVGRARQLAMSQRTTVYMVFVSTNFWLVNNTYPNAWFNNLTAKQLFAFTNLLDKQLIGYRFISKGQLGDQPGQHVWHYLDDKWQALPEGSFINTYKFLPASSPLLPLQIQNLNNNSTYKIYNFPAQLFPFPTEDAGVNLTTSDLALPYIAFNHLGQLSLDGLTLAPRDEYIPLVQGVVGYATDPATKSPLPTVVKPADILERPTGNSTGIGYNIIHIDRLTGRATLEHFKIQ